MGGHSGPIERVRERRQKRREEKGDGHWYDGCDSCDPSGCDVDCGGCDADCGGCDLFVVGMVGAALIVPGRRDPLAPVPAEMLPTPDATAAQRALLAALRVYKRRASPVIGAHCRYTPTCSGYAAEAIARYGAVRGVRLARARLRRCRPGGGRGLDPVPPSPLSA